MLELAPHLERFVAELFGIAGEVNALARRHAEQTPLFGVKRQFVQRRAANRIKPEEAQAFDGTALERELRKLFGGRFDELTYATHVARWLEAEADHGPEIELALRYAAWALHTEAGREHVRSRRAVQGAGQERSLPPGRARRALFAARCGGLSHRARAPAPPRRLCS